MFHNVQKIKNDILVAATVGPVRSITKLIIAPKEYCFLRLVTIKAVVGIRGKLLLAPRSIVGLFDFTLACTQ